MRCKLPTGYLSIPKNETLSSHLINVNVIFTVYLCKLGALESGAGYFKKKTPAKQWLYFEHSHRMYCSLGLSTWIDSAPTFSMRSQSPIHKLQRTLLGILTCWVHSRDLSPRKGLLHSWALLNACIIVAFVFHLVKVTWTNKCPGK